MVKSKPAPAEAAPARPAEYTVVARRYRPQQFAELIGQEHVAQALVNALQTSRVAHAYLFTGARGVGKTSAARILAKALNCEQGPTATPCDRCESCKAAAAGDDVDVVEIDGASNRGIDDARELRQNIGFRPARSRFKIYIIDEVHMLTKEAFNALLKTLEEPPPHAKFILATTEVQKIPITILSRCQRFDFAHVGPGKIFEQLNSIVRREGLQAEEEALRLVAKRAGGSMRDSQSLLDQLLASTDGTLTAAHVHTVLGTAGDERVTELASAILAHDARAALGLVSEWLDKGLQVGELVDQLIEYWRSLMLLSCAGADVRDLPLSPRQREALTSQVRSVSLDTLLSGLDVWTSTKSRMRGSSLAHVLLEMAVVKLSRLEDVLSVGQLLEHLAQSSGDVIPPSPKTPRTQSPPPNTRAGEGETSKKNAMIAPNGLEGGGQLLRANGPQPLSTNTLRTIWEALLQHLTERSPILANQLRPLPLPAIFGPNSLAIGVPASYTYADACSSERSIERIQDGLRTITGQTVTVKFDRVAGSVPASTANPADGPPAVSAAERRKELMQLPLFKKAADVLGAQLVMDDPEFSPQSVKPSPALPPATEEA